MNFLKWIGNGCPTHWSDEFVKGRGLTHPLNQWEYICDADGNILVDFVGRFETLNKDFNDLSKIIGINGVSLPHMNRSNHNSWESYYTPQAMDKVKELFKKDFQILKY